MLKEKITNSNLEFHELQKALFPLFSECFVELKPHTKVLKNLFQNMASKNLSVTTILQLCFSIGRKIHTH